jgi:hypothetical protein
VELDAMFWKGSSVKRDFVNAAGKCMLSFCSECGTDPDFIVVHDGLLDGAERTAGTNPFNADTDGDGLTDAQEVNLTHTNPKLADSNSNGISDALDDQDSDGLTNLAEITQHGTDPINADTDNDGVTDVEENAGAISAWDSSTGQLTVELYAGGTISGTVTDRTRVECEVADDGDDTPPPVDPAPASSQRDRHGDDDGDEGEHHHGDHHGGEGDLCSVDDLAVGVVVHEATVEFDSTGATFRKIEIVPPVTDPAA